MGQVRNWIGEGVKLCIVTEGPRAEVRKARYAKHFLTTFDDEIANKDSEFARVDGESIRDRLELMESIIGMDGVDDDRASYWIDMAELKATAVDVGKGNDGLMPQLEALREDLSEREIDHPEFSSLMTVAQASDINSLWD